ncbi:MAG: hypothetical protein ACRDTS_20020, partial [Mycobacterium sp.]
MSQRRAAHRRRGRYTGWLPFTCVIAAIVLLAGAGISWVISPNWGHHEAAAKPRSVGTVPASTPSPSASPIPSASPSASPVAAVSVAPYRIEIPKLGAR